MSGKWLPTGTKVKHLLSGWEGIVIAGVESQVESLGQCINIVRFFDGNNLVELRVVEEEIEVIDQQKPN